MFKLFSFIALLVSLSSSDKANMNEVVDQMLEKARIQVLVERREVTPIPEFKRVYPLGFHFDHKNVTGRLECKKGWARDMSTVKRTGEAVLSRVGTKLILDVALGMEVLEFGFERCEVSIEPFFSLARNFTVTVGRNTIHVEVSIQMNNEGGCRPSLDSFRVVQAENVQVHTGKGIAQQVKDKIISALIMHFRDEVLNVVTLELTDIARTQVSNTTFC